ncbi:MAG: hypothetical protein A3H72_01825 [Candidatus Doudnabacteria bacterium RIFCSPLOWO2_02_FULL_48_8]|uniref:Uncharacterized protein n=1 Tax=Candidatus Doudnabacteria bacterium RIFCSPHIGHO2_01_FULL_46_24 TaxID=1817825 RepID=A0A1F5NVW8_9BACT|nr:MAG: hypothetical protein A2720_00210 [Candidatus Doudnabacteria bacterium RIFCSPHIGHO2_01_FULL_46_24]OGE94975.1 MAG: hypothetical protein A3H72_01825 [Candidatus Doudnabacteria bacterium RIFCSPLOWO2_02_FULL_48_8]
MYWILVRDLLTVYVMIGTIFAFWVTVFDWRPKGFVDHLIGIAAFLIIAISWPIFVWRDR